MPSPTGEIAMTDPSLQHVFDGIVEAIQHTISKADQRTFCRHASIVTFLQDLEAMCASDPIEQQRLLACAGSIESFAKAFAPYCDVVSTFGQASLDFGWFCGLLHLVFKVGRNYIVFLEHACRMLETIGHWIPEKQPPCIPRVSATPNDGLVLLSSVYADIVGFCLELYCMFSRSSQGARLRHTTAAPWRPLESRLRNLRQRISKLQAWLEKEPQDRESMLVCQQKFLDCDNSTKENGQVEAERMSRQVRRIDRVKSWLSVDCAYQDTCADIVRRKHGSSCSWFMSIPDYYEWKNMPFEEQDATNMESLKTNWHERVLFVQAPSGYGKTFLSTCIIENLRSEAGDLKIDGEPATVAHFHFNTAPAHCSHPDHAFKALATQLVHSYQHDPSTINALSLLSRKTATQGKASRDDVTAVLSLLLRQHSTFIILDGIDECSDTEILLTTLAEICQKSDARVMLLSRPGIIVPLQYQKWASNAPHILSLSSQQSVPDIENYLTDNLNLMVQQGHLQTCPDRSAIVQIASLSNGVFLWASLLLKYLHSPELSLDERQISLEQVRHLEGVHTLYRVILMTLDRKSQEERCIAADVIRWLFSSISRLSTAQLQDALFSPASAGIDARNPSPSDFADLVTRMTGGLVDVIDGIFVFTHSSFKDYLQSGECPQLEFDMHDSGLVNGHLAARCLSYLINRVPRQPLQRLPPQSRPPGPVHSPSSGVSVRTGSSGDSGYKSLSSTPDMDGISMEADTEQTTQFDATMPFLRYATLSWPIHLGRALSQTVSRGRVTAQPTDGQHAAMPWLEALAQLLADRMVVTAWVEASWHYSLAPNLSRLLPLLASVQSELPPTSIEGRELEWVVHGLRELNDALDELRRDHGATMMRYPSLIWRASFCAQPEGRFWSTWDEARGCLVES